MTTPTYITDKHTPGPWKLYGNMIFRGHGDTDEVIGSIASVLDDDGFMPLLPDWDTAKVNGRLMAAAPEMLAALCMVEGWLIENLTDEPLDDGGVDIGCCPICGRPEMLQCNDDGTWWCHQVRAAIAQAQGEVAP